VRRSPAIFAARKFFSHQTHHAQGNGKNREIRLQLRCGNASVQTIIRAFTRAKNQLVAHTISEGDGEAGMRAKSQKTFRAPPTHAESEHPPLGAHATGAKLLRAPFPRNLHRKNEA